MNHQQLATVCHSNDTSNLIPINFLYNYLPRLPSFVLTHDWRLELPANRHQWDPTWENSFPLTPKDGGMPFHTSLTTARQCRFWKEALDYAFELYELLAADQSHHNIKLSKGGTLASIAQKELQKPAFERYVTSAINLWPQADAERLSLIACGIILVVTFDDFWEEASSEDLVKTGRDFIDRMQGRNAKDEEKNSPLALRLNDIVDRCKECDERTGTDAGHEFINTMLEWVMHSQPEGEFKTPREYLDYRWMDAANSWLIASCKFSIASPVSVRDPILQSLIRLVGDHGSIVNDLASFDKELAAFESGKTKVLINLVQVMREACGLSIDEAKTTVYTLQLLNEKKLQQEVVNLQSKGNEVTLEHWRFIDSLLAMLGGNCYYVITTERYGGKAARVIRSV